MIFVVIVLTVLKVVTAILHPDTGLSVSQLLERHGYPFEDHRVQTRDGYVLGLHRVPHGAQNRTGKKNKSAVLLVHGMCSQSIDFINNEPWNSLGTLLADGGYDVWMLNTRGNTYSRKHVTLDPDLNKTKFWDFSWHEVGIYDLPDTIDYILNLIKQDDLFYVGHSEGVTSYFVMTSELPEYNKKIRHMAAMGPAVFMSHNQDVKWRAVADFFDELKLLAVFGDLHEFMPHSDVWLDLVKEFCLEGEETYNECVDLYYFAAGYSPEELNMTLLPVHLSNTPSGFSVKEGFHYLQSMTNGGFFRHYDYGRQENLRRYGTEVPPNYDLTKAVAPVTLHYAQADQLVDYRDSEKLGAMLRNVQLHLVSSEYFTHIDFIWGAHVKSLVYDYIFADFSKY